MQSQDQTGGQKVEGVQHKLALPDDGALPPCPTVIPVISAATTVVVVPEELMGLHDALHGVGLNGHMTWTRMR